LAKRDHNIKTSHMVMMVDAFLTHIFILQIL